MVEILKKLLKKHFVDKVTFEYLDDIKKVKLSAEEKKELIFNIESVVNERCIEAIRSFVNVVIDTDTELDDEISDYLWNSKNS